MKKTIYVGCSLTSATRDFILFIEELKSYISTDFELLEFVGIDPQATPLHVYKTDINCAQKADVMLAVVDQSSTGLGMEIQSRIDLKKPTLIVYKRGSQVSKMPLGAAEMYPFMSSLQYDSINDIVVGLKKYA